MFENAFGEIRWERHTTFQENPTGYVGGTGLLSNL